MVKTIMPRCEILDDVNGEEMIKAIERAGRTCYKSENKITKDSARDFIKMILKNGHESVLEHEKVSVRIICDRGVSHEIVRHRIASYSQESTRYCNYAKDKFGNEITVIDITTFFLYCNLSEEDHLKACDTWLSAMRRCEQDYKTLIDLGVQPQIARSVLPNSLKTEIVVTYNLREWRHFFKLRTTLKAHPQMRQIINPLLTAFKELIPVVFDDIEAEKSPNGLNY
jgi:thymidylate synthase (FAD)